MHRSAAGHVSSPPSVCRRTRRNSNILRIFSRYGRMDALCGTRTWESNIAAQQGAWLSLSRPCIHLAAPTHVSVCWCPSVNLKLRTHTRHQAQTHASLPYTNRPRQRSTPREKPARTMYALILRHATAAPRTLEHVELPSHWQHEWKHEANGEFSPCSLPYLTNDDAMHLLCVVDLCMQSLIRWALAGCRC